MPQSLYLVLLCILKTAPLCVFHFVTLLGSLLSHCTAKLVLFLMSFDMALKYSLDSSSAQHLDFTDVDHTL